jgi:peptidoglycan/xylan/chitin deacetylase (PgdA/CDA1 family)
MMTLKSLSKEVIYNTAHLAGFTWLSRHRLQGRMVIFTYHSFAASKNESRVVNSIPIQLFQRQLRFLQQHYQMISLSEGLHLLREEMSTKTATGKPYAIITVDDGFADNYTLLFPLVRQYHIPVTIFVATDFLDTGRPPWPTQIVQLIKETEVSSLQYPIPLKLSDKYAKNKAIYAIMAVWKHLPPEERLMRVQELRKHLKVAKLTPVQPLTWEQVKEMRRHSVEFGSHTRYHSILPAVSETVAIQELQDSKQRLETELNEECILFSYPNGDWSDTTRNGVEKTGYRCAVTQNRGSNQYGTDPYCLKRIEVPYNETLGTFACRSSLLAL